MRTLKVIINMIQKGRRNMTQVKPLEMKNTIFEV